MQFDNYYDVDQDELLLLASSEALMNSHPKLRSFSHISTILQVCFTFSGVWFSC
jgi:hypothetical protein